MNTYQYDFAVIGAGITGLAIARSLLNIHPGARIGVFEKEPQLGAHGSGRNSGVLHSGIYYPENSLKAKFCANGSKQLTAFCEEHGLPISRMGKVIVPTRPEQDPQIDLLHARSMHNGAEVRIIDRQQLKEIEPESASATDRALYSPETAVIEPLLVLKKLNQLLQSEGVSFHYATRLEKALPDQNCFITQTSDRINYRTLFNAAGQHADRIAHLFGTADQYTLLPFKGMYFSLAPQSGIHLNGLVYPVPDLNVPFLGVHSVKKISGEVYFGPTAIPALGRENYIGLKGLEPAEAARICGNLAIQYWKNLQGFRNYAHEEAGRFVKSRFAEAARVLIPRLQTHHLIPSAKVGIRAQLLNTKTRQLEMDFLVHTHGNTVHVLNAVSPAFTSAFPFAEHVVELATGRTR
jgi:L-2-hydroxyglutarate oxidase LhgO